MRDTALKPFDERALQLKDVRQVTHGFQCNKPLGALSDGQAVNGHLSRCGGKPLLKVGNTNPGAVSPQFRRVLRLQRGVADLH